MTRNPLALAAGQPTPSADMEQIPDPWPLRHLVLRTPRLELRPDDDAGLLELVDQVHRGVHPPEQMPFTVPWTDQPKDVLGRNVLQFYWSQRATLATDKWTLNFLVRFDGEVIGSQGISATDFPVTRTVRSGSWLGLRHQGKGLGTEMRAAVLAFAFDHLGAREAMSDAWTDNAASIRVSRKLGYRDNGSSLAARRAEPVRQQEFVVRPDEFVRPEWTLEVSGSEGCLPLLRG
jgi:RimJ/RimL family protein N-acetyltransferase